MKTYPHLKKLLERKILASALWSFRKIKKPEGITATKFAFASMCDFSGALDYCEVDVATWRLETVTYDVWEGNKVINKTIHTASL